MIQDSRLAQNCASHFGTSELVFLKATRTQSEGKSATSVRSVSRDHSFSLGRVFPQLLPHPGHAAPKFFRDLFVSFFRVGERFRRQDGITKFYAQLGQAG